MSDPVRGAGDAVDLESTLNRRVAPWIGRKARYRPS
jgi:hypothetical protein